MLLDILHNLPRAKTYSSVLAWSNATGKERVGSTYVGRQVDPLQRDVERGHLVVGGALRADHRSLRERGELDPHGAVRNRALPAHGRLVIGRDRAADVVVDWDAAASRRHAAVAPRLRPFRTS